MRCLLIDLGSSRLKWAFTDGGSAAPVSVHTQDTSAFVRKENGRCEIALPDLAQELRTLIVSSHRQEALGAVYLSVQMHGTALFDAPCQPAMPFITWEDTRALIPSADGTTALERVMALLPEDIMQRTGGHFNASFTAVQLTSLQADGFPVTGRRLALLGDAVTEMLVGHPVPMHVTNACTTGLYDLTAHAWSDDILARLSLTGLILPPVVDDVCPVGNFLCDDSAIPIYAAVGDLQASVMGAQVEADELILNVGTGSQVISITNTLRPGDCETRSYFDGRFLNTITHIPAGRSLNRLVDFFLDVGKRLFGCEIPRSQVCASISEHLSALDSAQGLAMSMYFFDRDMNGRYGSLEGITHSNFTFDRMLFAAYAGMAQDYYRQFRRLRTSGTVRGICMIGGVSQRSPVLVRQVEEVFALPVRVADVAECALSGLARLTAQG